MLPSRKRLDPDGYYNRLGVRPAATRADIIAAFRAKALLLHPDVPKTGNTSAFVALKQAYDVLSNEDQRSAYDRMAREAARSAVKPQAAPMRTTAYQAATVPARPSRFLDIPVMICLGLGAFLCVCIYQVVAHLLTPERPVRDEIKPNAATVEPLSPSAHNAILYGATPVRLAGSPNFYVVPAASPAVLWRLDRTRNTLVPLSQLPPFSLVQAVRLIRQNGMLEVLVNDQSNGFIGADHLTPGNAASARRAYCGFNAGQIPNDGELLERRGDGAGKIEIENRAAQPAVVKLRDETGVVALSVFLGSGGHAVFDGLPEGSYYTEFAIGELWSRACNSFAAGMQAQRMNAVVKMPGDAHLVVAPDLGEPTAVDIPDQAFERK